MTGVEIRFTCLRGPQVVQLLDAYLARFQIAPEFDAEDVAHYLLPIPGVVHSYVIEAEGASPCTSPCMSCIVDFCNCSLYTCWVPAQMLLAAILADCHVCKHSIIAARS